MAHQLLLLFVVLIACNLDGVMTAPVDMLLPKHPQMDVPNLEVLKLMESFVYVRLLTCRVEVLV